MDPGALIGRRRRGLARGVALAIACCATVIACCATAAASRATLTWSTITGFDRAAPVSRGIPLSTVACATDRFCLTFGSLAFTSTAPRTGVWTAARPPARIDATRVVCPSQSLCVGWNTRDIPHDVIYATTAPASGTWTATTVPLQSQIAGVACPSAMLCIAIDANGHVVTSSDPAAGAWTAAPALPPTFEPSALSCPTVSLCVVAGTQPSGTGNDYKALGAVEISTDPSRGAWTQQVVDPNGDGLAALSCPATNLCVAVDGRNAPVASRSPASGAWTVGAPIGNAGPGDINGLACSQAGGCISNGIAGYLWGSSSPSGPWKRIVLDKLGGAVLSDFTCAQTLCLAVDTAGNVFSATDPGGRWTRHLVAGVNPLLAVSCTAESLCATVDATGHAFTTTSPSGGASAWRVAEIDRGHALSAVACAAASLCVAGDKRGALFARSGAANASWRVVAAPTGKAIVALACPTDTLCVALDRHGDMLRSRRPRTRGSWSGFRLARGLSGVSCPSIHFCAVSAGQQVFVSSNPAGGPSAWHPRRPHKGYDLFTISCADARHCVALAEPGCCQVDSLATRAPFGERAWRFGSVADYAHQGDILPSLSCPTATLCVEVDNFGNAAETTSPFLRPRWSQTMLEPQDSSFALNGVSCAGGHLCLAVDDHGALFIGKR